MQAEWNGWRKRVSGVTCENKKGLCIKVERSQGTSSETSCVVWQGDGGADENTGGGAEGGGVT